MNHFGDAVKDSASQTFLNELFIFWRELNRHIGTSSYGRIMNPPVGCQPALQQRYLPPSSAITAKAVAASLMNLPASEAGSRCLFKEVAGHNPASLS